MSEHILSRDSYREKVMGCWLGKTVGGTLGQPHEGKEGPLGLTFYDPVPDGAIANDDLDLQLVWLAKLREVGPEIGEGDLADAWRDHLTYPWDEYGLCRANLLLGLEPPVSGQHNNWFTDSMGAPIRSEIWACVAPGCPDLAAALACQDGCVDHGGAGLVGEIFFAALESAAFVADDKDQLLDLALGFIPPDSRVAEGVRVVRERHASGDDWLMCRNAVIDAVGHENFTDAAQNIAFTILGWRYGDDAADAMCTAVNCGRDTDCTGATLGAILGLVGGPDCFEEHWTDPIGNEIKVGYGVIDCELPETLEELTDWTCEAAEEMLRAHDAPVQLGDADNVEGLDAETLAATDRVRAKLEHLDWQVTKSGDVLKLVSDYGGEPAIAPGESITIACSAIGELPDDAGLSMTAPDGWSVRPGTSHREPGLLRRGFTVTKPAGEGPAAIEFLEPSIMSGDEQVLGDRIGVVGKHGWRVYGPVRADGPLADSLDTALPEEGWRVVHTNGHALVLDDGLDYDRLYFVQLVLRNPEPKQGRIVCATPELQLVRLEGDEIIRKTEPTRFVPAPHRSGPGTVHEMEQLPEAIRLTITLGVNAGARAELHCFLTERNDPEHLYRNCPIVGVLGTAPQDAVAG